MGIGGVGVEFDSILEVFEGLVVVLQACHCEAEIEVDVSVKGFEF